MHMINRLSIYIIILIMQLNASMIECASMGTFQVLEVMEKEKNNAFESYVVQNEKGKYLAKIFKSKQAFRKVIRVLNTSNRLLVDKYFHRVIGYDEKMTIKYIGKQDKNPLRQDLAQAHTFERKTCGMIIQMAENISLSKLSSHKKVCKRCGMISSKLYSFIENQLNEALNMLQSSKICWKELKLSQIKIQKDGNIKIETEKLGQPQNEKFQQQDFDFTKKNVDKILRQLSKFSQEPQNLFIIEQYSQNSKIFSEQQSLTQQMNLSSQFTQQVLKHIKCVTVKSQGVTISQHSQLKKILQTQEQPNEFKSNIFGLFYCQQQ